MSVDVRGAPTRPDEQKWYALADPAGLIFYFRLQNHKRKLRLWLVACSAGAWHLLSKGSRNALEIAERFADWQATPEELEQAHQEADRERSEWETRAYQLDDELYFQHAGVDSGKHGTEQVIPLREALADAQHRLCATNRILAATHSNNCTSSCFAWCYDALSKNESGVAAHLIRDIFANPTRPTTFDPVWRSETVVLLAREMYGSRDFSAMPILADALQEAGCDNGDILHHCRNPEQVHVRGCWVIDLILEKT